MVNVWKVAPGERGKFKDLFIRYKCIAVGWKDIGDLRKYKTKEEFISEYRKIYSENGETSYEKELKNYYYDIKPNHIVTAMAQKKIYSIGIVKGNYFYADSDELPYKHRIIVDWNISEYFKLDNDKMNNTNFPRKNTVKEIPINIWNTMKQEIKDKYPDVFSKIQQLEEATQEIVERRTNNSKNHYASKNIILYGPPGTGKTYESREVAVDIIERDKNG